MFRYVLLICLVASSIATPLAPVPTLDGRIVGGQPADISEVPYIVALLVDWGGLGFYYHHCGAVIIKENVVLTAAHCADLQADRAVAKVRAGSNEHADGGQVADVERFVLHEYYNSRLDYDFAIGFLSESLITDNKVAVATLPVQGQTIMAGTIAVTSGWGSIQEGGAVQDTLNKVSLPIVDQGVCEAFYGSVNPVTPRMVCAGIIGAGGADACQGDSGGPLTVNDVLVGITSWGFGCARPSYPGVWARVPSVMDWINEMLQQATRV